MDAAQVTQVIHQVLMQIQSGQNLDCPPLDDQVQPIRDLRQFDSPVSLAATGMVGRALGLKIDPKVNIFGNKSGLHTIGKSVALLCKMASEQKSKEPAKA
jgi:hypothetical protein